LQQKNKKFKTNVTQKYTFHNTIIRYYYDLKLANKGEAFFEMNFSTLAYREILSILPYYEHGQKTLNSKYQNGSHYSRIGYFNT